MPAKKKKQQPLGRASKSVWPAHALRIAILWTAAFLAYSNSFDGGLVFDNATIIGQDPRIRAASAENAGLIFTREYWYPATNSGLYRPLTTFSYLLNYSVLGDGPNPQGYHLFNLGLHLVNVALAYGLGLLLFEGSGAALAMAAIWALHPLLTESVTNIVGRADLLAGWGVLAGLLCHLRAIRTSGRQKILWLAGLGAAQAIGIFSKENAAILPALMLLYDLIYARHTRAEWRGRVANYAAIAVPLCVYAFLRSRIDTHMIITFAVNPIAGAAFLAGRMTAVEVMGKLSWLFFWPARLSADYSFSAIPLLAGGSVLWAMLIAAAAVAALIALAIRVRRNKPALFFLGFFFLALAPTSNLLFPIGAIMADRFMYLPSLALCGLAALAFQWANVRPSIKWGALAALCIALGARTYTRNFDWSEEISLWSSAIAAYPDCARAHYNLGRAFAARSDYAKAIPEYQTALRILPDYPHANVNLGVALERMPGALPQAIAHFRDAVKQDPGLAEAHYNLGDALARGGDAEGAIAELQAAVRIEPDFVEAHNDLGAIASATGRYSDAIAEYRTALRSKPDYAAAHNGLGMVYLRLHRSGDAIAEYQTVVQLHPDSADAHLNLGNAWVEVPGRFQDAMNEYAAAIRLRPDLGEPHYRMGMALLRAGRDADALAELETALRINPDPQGQRMVEELRARQRR